MKSDSGHYEKFLTFFEKEWTPDLVMLTSDFTQRFGLDRHLTRFYLFERMTRKEGLLFRVMYKNKASFIIKTPENLNMFKRFVWIGVQVEEH